MQFLVSPLLLWKSFLSATISCALYAVALSYYHYLNFLGYSALPFLERTEVGGVADTLMAQLATVAVAARVTASVLHCL